MLKLVNYNIKYISEVQIFFNKHITFLWAKLVGVEVSVKETQPRFCLSLTHAIIRDLERFNINFRF